MKDVGIDSVLYQVESPSRWPFDFERKQQEIIELWHRCNVPLVHRTYFFLLYNGDPTDSIYIEVEHRRLSFLRNTSSHVHCATTVAIESSHNPTSSSRYITSLVPSLSSFKLDLYCNTSGIQNFQQLKVSPPRKRNVVQAYAEEAHSARKDLIVYRLGNRSRLQTEEMAARPTHLDQNRYGTCQRECFPCGQANWSCGARAGPQGDVWTQLPTTTN